MKRKCPTLIALFFALFLFTPFAAYAQGCTLTDNQSIDSLYVFNQYQDGAPFLGFFDNGNFPPASMPSNNVPSLFSIPFPPSANAHGVTSLAYDAKDNTLYAAVSSVSSPLPGKLYRFPGPFNPSTTGELIAEISDAEIRDIAIDRVNHDVIFLGLFDLPPNEDARIDAIDILNPSNPPVTIINDSMGGTHTLWHTPSATPGQDQLGWITGNGDVFVNPLDADGAASGPPQMEAFPLLVGSTHVAQPSCNAVRLAQTVI